MTCPPTPGLDSSYYDIDFTKTDSTPDDWVVPTWCRVTYNTKGRQNGAELEFLERYDSQQLYSSFYFLFGRIEFVVQAAPGPGIISDMMTLSDDLDELDWEFRGTLDDEVQTGWFGKGVTGLYNHSITPKIPTPMTQFHTYAFDWTADRVIWEADGAVVRTLYAADCVGTANQYPQTPMKAMIGLWDAGDPDHYDPWSAGLTPIPPPAGGYSFYVKSVKIWNNNPAACYDWVGHSGSWQSIKAVNDSSACGISPTSSSTIVPISSTVSSLSSMMVSLSSTTSSSSSMITSLSPTTSSFSSTTVPISSTTSSSLSKITSLSQATSSISATSSSSSNIATSLPAMLSSHPFSASSSMVLQRSSSASSSSSTIATSTSATSSSHQLSANSSTLLQVSSSASSIQVASPTQSVNTGKYSSMVPSSQGPLGTQSSNMLASGTIVSGTESSSAQIPSTSSSSLHPSSSQQSSTYTPSLQSGSTHLPSTTPLSVSSPTSVTGTQMSPTNSSSPIISSTLSNTVPSIQASAYQSPNSTRTSPGSQTSIIPQTLGETASMSSSSRSGSLEASTATLSATGSMVVGSSSVQSATPSSVVPSTSDIFSGVSSTVVTPTQPASSGILATTKSLSKTSSLQTTAAPQWNTITIIVALPGHQTLSYSPAVQELEKLILSIESLIRQHRHFPKRDLASTPPETSTALSQSSLADAAPPSHHHGHQHDHLHDPLHRRNAANQAPAAVPSDAPASVAMATLAASTAASRATLLLHADGQDAYSFADEVNVMGTVPGSLLPEQSATSQASPASSPGDRKGAQAISQQQDSAASVFGKGRSRWSAVLGSCVLWVVFMIALCQ